MRRYLRLDESFSKRLKALRRRAGLTQTDLADKAGITYRTVHDIEEGRRDRVLERTLIVIAAAVGVSFDELLGAGEGDGAAASGSNGGNSRRGDDSPAPETAGGLIDASLHDPDRSTSSGSSERPARRGGFLRPITGSPALPLLLSLGTLVLLALAVTVHVMTERGYWRTVSSMDGAASPAALSFDDLPITQATTDVPCAYRAFVEGMEYWRMLQRREARAAFERAVACDSTMAMAWAMLGHPYSDYPVEKRRRCMSKALALSQGASERERLYIEALARMSGYELREAVEILEGLVSMYPDFSDAHRLLGHLYASRILNRTSRSIAAYRSALGIDPRDAMSLKRLAYGYAAAGDYESALDAARRYIELAPGEADPYDTRGKILSWMGRWDEAMESYGKALGRDPDFYPSLYSLACLHLGEGDYRRAGFYARRLLGVGDVGARVRGRFILAAMPLFEGRASSALALLKGGIDADRVSMSPGEGGCWDLFSKALALYESGDIEGASCIAEEIVESWIENEWNCEDVVPASLFLIGNAAPETAESLLGRLKDVYRGAARTGALAPSPQTDGFFSGRPR